MSGPIGPFHLALPVDDLDAARAFYGGVLGCPVGRTAKTWVDFDFFGHQLTVHRAPDAVVPVAKGSVDGDAVAVRHFGVVLPWERWQGLQRTLEEAGVAYILAPKIRFPGQVGEQGTFFVADPAGNALEFKAFGDPERLFAS